MGSLGSTREIHANAAQVIQMALTATKQYILNRSPKDAQVVSDSGAFARQ
jgi:hypothetical protein